MKKLLNKLFSRMVITCLLVAAQLIFFMVEVFKLQQYYVLVAAILHLLSFIAVMHLLLKDVNPSIKLAWIVPILMFPVLGGLLYLLYGHIIMPKKLEKYMKHAAEWDYETDLYANMAYFSDVIKGQQPYRLFKYTEDYAGSLVYQNTDVTYYNEALKGLEAQLEELAKAEHFIFMEYHAIEDAEAWHRIQNVLEERVRAGVEVRVFYDDMGSIGFINTDFIKKLEAVGIRCRVFNPFMPGLNMFLNNRDHRKITVIDGKIGFTGGYNLANEYFNLTHPYGQWKDTGIRLEGDAVRSLTVTFLEMWNAISDRDENDTEFSRFLTDYPYEAQQTGFIQPYADSPLDNEQVGEEIYISMVNKAEKYCWFMTPYLIITDEMAHALTLAAKRGVDVRIITPGISDKKMIYSVTRSFYHELVKDGVRIYEWTPGFCHAKMSVADDCMATCGTINLDYRSLYHHFENGCFMADCDVVLNIRDDLQETMRACRDVTEKYRTGRSAYLRLGQLLMRLFAGLL